MQKDTEIFCQNIKRIRETNNLSKKKMAEYCGISVGSLNKIEQGIIPERLSARILIAICSNFDIKPKDLFK